MTTKFKPGDWIIAAGGIGEVISSEQLYIEEFQIKEGQSVGDPEKVDVFFKLLCNLEGKIRKRNRFEVVREEYCKKIRAKDAKMVAKIKLSSPSEFLKFQEAEGTVGMLNGLEYKIPEDQLESTVTKLQEAVKTLQVPFTYAQFIDACRTQGVDLIGIRATPAERNMKVLLNNEGGKTRDKRRLFTAARILKVEPAM